MYQLTIQFTIIYIFTNISSVSYNMINQLAQISIHSLLEGTGTIIWTLNNTSNVWNNCSSLFFNVIISMMDKTLSVSITSLLFVKYQS